MREPLPKPRVPAVAEPPEGTDVEVIEAVLRGRTERYSVLVRRHQSALFRVARIMGMAPETAADLVQDTLVKAYEDLARCRERSRFRAWASRILRNRCLDHLKSARVRRDVPLPPSLPGSRDDPERSRQRTALRETLAAALETLAPEQREAFLLKHGEGYAYEEIAELTACSVGAAKMRVHRAREALRTRLRRKGALEDL